MKQYGNNNEDWYPGSIEYRKYCVSGQKCSYLREIGQQSAAISNLFHFEAMGQGEQLRTETPV